MHDQVVNWQIENQNTSNFCQKDQNVLGGEIEQIFVTKKTLVRTQARISNACGREIL